MNPLFNLTINSPNTFENAQFFAFLLVIKMYLDTKLKCGCGKERSLYDFLVALGYSRVKMTADFSKFAPEVKKLLPKLVCSRCKRKGQIHPVLYKIGKIRRKKSTPYASRLVATDLGLDRIFHRQTCSYAKIINRRDEIFFDDREEAISSGFDPCKNCCP